MRNSSFYKLSENKSENMKDLDDLIDVIEEKIKNATDDYEKSLKESDVFDQGWWTGVGAGLYTALRFIKRLKVAQNEKHSGK